MVSRDSHGTSEQGGTAMKLKCFYLIALSGACLLSPTTSYADGFFHFGLSFGSPDFRISFLRSRRTCTPSRAVVTAPARRTIYTPPAHRAHRVHRAAHRHFWTSRASRIWVAPVHQTVFAGFDHCRRPVYREIITRPGYYRTVFTEHCACGASH